MGMRAVAPRRAGPLPCWSVAVLVRCRYAPILGLTYRKGSKTRSSSLVLSSAGPLIPRPSHPRNGIYRRLPLAQFPDMESADEDADAGLPPLPSGGVGVVATSSSSFPPSPPPTADGGGEPDRPAPAPLDDVDDRDGAGPCVPRRERWQRGRKRGRFCRRRRQ